MFLSSNVVVKLILDQSKPLLSEKYYIDLKLLPVKYVVMFK